jgi:hypothetical protein
MPGVVSRYLSLPLRIAGLSLAFAVLLLRTAVPAGWMVSATPGEAFEIVICTADGAVTMTGELPPENAPKDSKSGECLFSALNAAATGPADCETPVTTAEADAALAVDRSASPGRGLAAPPPPATGPPATA